MVTAWILLLAPALAGVGIALVARRSHTASAGLAIGSLGLSFLCALTLSLQFPWQMPGTVLQASVPWVNLPGFSLEFGILLDPLALLMSLVVTGVGLMIFIYSVGYMANDRGFTRYFAFLCLFAFSMLGIVLSNNFVTLFIFWELVGASSYLLIGHWYERSKAAEAGKKAFLVNRIADFGFLVGILMLWGLSGLSEETKTLNFPKLAENIEGLTAFGIASPETLGWIGALIFCGVVGKSAQFPLHVWLPDAMEGPTPVSALIHAATMVAAGVYLLARVFFLFSGLPGLLEWIAIVGGFTAFFAASLALVENDIKRVLAYSTLSQLGYMVMALGLGSSTAGMYHLTTHAFFKALLFMGAGCVIHTLRTNNIWEMGGLYKAMPTTTLTFSLALLALCGIFPLSGFFSKEEILTLAFTENRFLWVVATSTVGLTAFYMGRLFCVAFLGSPRTSLRAHEAPGVMTGPLVVLAIPSVTIGFLGIPGFLQQSEAAHTGSGWIVAAFSSLMAFGGLGLSFLLYERGLRPIRGLRRTFGWAYELLVRRFFVDEIYAWVNQNIQQRTAIFLSLFERYVIIGLWVNGTAKMTGLAGGVLRLAQTGKVQGYVLSLLLGLALLLFFVVSGPWAR